ncbi:hypothetical protein B0H17DRAFT_1141920 [Mycena rosella]|uniref:Uncharacterized protein n=1 Tax=Mycena rosella TaxID=1033263 RepID=A0AAD7CZW6_MYCRO|nr:hypothetical protein B0H17DRAFT_1141920 [Mycena rosella]
MSPHFIRSDRCLSSSKSAESPGTWCATVAHDVEALRDHAKELFSYVRVEERSNQEQTLEKVAQLKEQSNDLKLEKSISTDRELEAFPRVGSRRRREFKENFHYLGTHSVPGLHQMLPKALTQKWGAKKFLEMITAYLGDYTPRSYPQYDIDLAILLYELGCASAVYAMNHSIFALPSLNTLQPYRRRLSRGPVELLQGSAMSGRGLGEVAPRGDLAVICVASATYCFRRLAALCRARRFDLAAPIAARPLSAAHGPHLSVQFSFLWPLRSLPQFIPVATGMMLIISIFFNLSDLSLASGMRRSARGRAATCARDGNGRRFDGSPTGTARHCTAR